MTPSALRGPGYAAFVVLGAFSLLVGCGRVGDEPRGQSTTPGCQLAVGCGPADPQLNISANNAYRDFHSAAPDVMASATALLPRVEQALKVVRAHPPVTETSVQATLSRALPGLSVMASRQAARIPEGVGFGITVIVGNNAGCVHGWVSERGQSAEASGSTTGEGCLPLLGH